MVTARPKTHNPRGGWRFDARVLIATALTTLGGSSVARATLEGAGSIGLERKAPEASGLRYGLALEGGLASIDPSGLTAAVVDDAGRRASFEYGIGLHAATAQGLHLALSVGRRAFGKTSIDYESNFTGNYSISGWMTSFSASLGLLELGRPSSREFGVAAPRGGMLGPLVEAGFAWGHEDWHHRQAQAQTDDSSQGIGVAWCAVEDHVVVELGVAG